MASARHNSTPWWKTREAKITLAASVIGGIFTIIAALPSWISSGNPPQEPVPSQPNPTPSPDEMNVPISGDWDGNGTTTPGVLRPDDAQGKWTWELSNNTRGGQPDVTFAYGEDSSTPVVGDWDGNRNSNSATTPGTVGPSEGHWTWLLRNSTSSGPPEISFVYGRVRG